MLATMRQHELLYFMDGLETFLGRAPTREELSYNFWYNVRPEAPVANREFLMGGKARFVGGPGSMRGILRQLKTGKLVREKRCSPRCHARHLELTPKGRRTLEYWNEHGCETEQREQTGCERGSFSFQQVKIAS